MTDRERWQLRGLVRSCRIERIWRANCGPDGCDLQQRGDASMIEFSRDGTLLRSWHRNTDGSQFATVGEVDADGRITSVETQTLNAPVTRRRHVYDAAGRRIGIWAASADAGEILAERYEYDPDGQRTKTVQFDVSAPGENISYSWGVEGTDSAFSAIGATSVTTVYGASDRPIALLFRDAQDTVISRVVFTYDENGHLIDEAQNVETGGLPAEMLENLNEAQLGALHALLGTTDQPRRRMHRYDAYGRRIETLSSAFGPMGGNRKTMAYNDQGDVAEEHWEDDSREFEISDDGRLLEKAGSERLTRSEARMRYEYDGRGNWTIKTVESRNSPDAEFVMSTTERRTLAYYD